MPDRTYSQVAKSYDTAAKLSRSLGIGAILALVINTALWGILGFFEFSAVMVFLFAIANYLTMRKASALRLKVFSTFYTMLLGASLATLFLLVLLLMLI